MKRRATTKKHAHAHDKIRKTKKEMDIFSIAEEVEKETWWDPRQFNSIQFNKTSNGTMHETQRKPSADEPQDTAEH